MNKLTYLPQKIYRNLFFNRENCNKRHLEFNKKISSTVEDICEPLSSLGATMFTYSRIFNGGERIYISSNGQWVEHYITHEFQDEIDHWPHYVPLDGIKYTFWSEFKDDKVFNAVNKYGMGNGISIYENHEEYVDFFDFAFDKDNTQAINFTLNNIHLFQKFVEYFKEKIFLILDFKDKKNILIPKKFISFDKIPREKSLEPRARGTFLNKTLKKEESYNKMNRLILCNNELDCLELLSKGNSIKSISRSLNLSPNSVRSYVNISKMKLDLRTIKELLDLYQKVLKRT